MAVNIQIFLVLLVLTNLTMSHPSRKRVTYNTKEGEPSNVKYITKVEENGEEVEEQKVKLNCQVYKKSEKNVAEKRKEELIAAAKDETEKPPVKKDVQKTDPAEQCKPTKTAEIIRAPNRTGTGCNWNSQRDAQGRCRPVAR